ncbi:hypothetical protein RND71_021589 [Anisodus tanguticus]|uniref:Uncharacterized protein n=1 Tax=Anisodus tanguticus TaxID=243964 RepID=A0AAE1RWK7_9SOLA|nr:hypothetical protein RND71_021589 [Anisodus tanguticus]
MLESMKDKVGRMSSMYRCGGLPLHFCEQRESRDEDHHARDGLADDSFEKDHNSLAGDRMGDHFAYKGKNNKVDDLPDPYDMVGEGMKEGDHVGDEAVNECVKVGDDADKTSGDEVDNVVKCVMGTILDDQIVDDEADECVEVGDDTLKKAKACDSPYVTNFEYGGTSVQAPVVPPTKHIFLIKYPFEISIESAIDLNLTKMYINFIARSLRVNEKGLLDFFSEKRDTLDKNPEWGPYCGARQTIPVKKVVEANSELIPHFLSQIDFLGGRSDGVLAVDSFEIRMVVGLLTQDNTGREVAINLEGLAFELVLEPSQSQRMSDGFFCTQAPKADVGQSSCCDGESSNADMKKDLEEFQVHVDSKFAEILQAIMDLNNKVDAKRENDDTIGYSGGMHTDCADLDVDDNQGVHGGDDNVKDVTYNDGVGGGDSSKEVVGEENDFQSDFVFVSVVQLADEVPTKAEDNVKVCGVGSSGASGSDSDSEEEVCDFVIPPSTNVVEINDDQTTLVAPRRGRPR